MFWKSRRARTAQPQRNVTPPPTLTSGSPLALNLLVEPRQVGRTIEDRALLAQLLSSPPAWDNVAPSVLRAADVELSQPRATAQPGATPLFQPGVVPGTPPQA